MTVTMTRPLPRRTRDSVVFWDACRDHRLVLQRCVSCDEFRYFPMPGCPNCGSSEFNYEEVGQRGSLVNFTVVHAKLNPAFDVPYVLGVVELECGARMVSRIIDCDPDTVEVSTMVEVVWEDEPSANTSIPAFRQRIDVGNRSSQT
jgi:uncharacterized OB-fold protein